MTPSEFQASYSGELKAFFDTKCGREYISLLNGLRPAYEFPVHEHLMLANRESIRGYEMCLRNMVALTMPPKVQTEVPANYGVEDKK